MAIALPVRSYFPVAWAAEIVAAPVTTGLDTPATISAVEKSLEGRFGSQQVAVSSRLTGEHAEGGARKGVETSLPPIATELSERSGQFSWVMGKNFPALRWWTLVLMARIGYRLLSKYKEQLKVPVLSFMPSYGQKSDASNTALKETGHLRFQGLLPMTFVMRRSWLSSDGRTIRR
jgi:hypothetical protein